MITRVNDSASQYGNGCLQDERDYRSGWSSLWHEAFHSWTPTCLSRFLFCYFLPLVNKGQSVLPGSLCAFLTLTFAQVIGPA